MSILTEYAIRSWGSAAERAAKCLAKRTELDPVTGCVNWTGHTHRNGYAQCYMDSTGWLGHRLAWSLFVGDPGKLWVLHKCDNRRCINTAHLFLGTRQDNMDDMVRKGRSNAPRGEASPSAVLTELDVLTIRSSYKPWSVSYRSLAEQFGVSPTQVRAIIAGRKWAWLRQPTGV